MADVIALGEALIDFVSQRSGVGLADAPGFEKAPGGAPANVAVAVARLGTSSAFLGKVGDDPFGRFLERTFREAGVDTSLMLFDPQVKTGLAFVSLMADGERDFTFYRDPSADMMLREDEIDEGTLAQARALHYGSITLIAQPARSATLKAVRLAKDMGKFISYDPNLRLSLWENAADAKREMLAGMPYADFVKVSEEELEFLLGKMNVASGAQRLMREGPRLVAVTRGAEGCYACTASCAVDLPGFVVETVDTTGAGDGFVGGVLHRLLLGGAEPEIDGLEEADLHSIFTFANAVGALATTCKGAIPSMPSGMAVQSLLDR